MSPVGWLEQDVEHAPGEPESKCGTYAGWNAHNYYGEYTCAPCRKAASNYQRDRRKANGNVSGIRYNKARTKALTKLAHLHESEFQRLLTAELRAIRESTA